jgi:hypothetical protein
MSDMPVPSQRTLYGNWTPGWFRPHNPSIGGIIAEVIIEEQETDDLTITEHPVEQGAPIADHAFKRPSQVTVRAGWTVSGSMDLSAESGVYGLLLSWQAALMPFDLLTTKRSYSNMLIERLSVSTDQASRFALMAQITCKQIFIVGTQTTQVSGMSNNPDNHGAQQTNGGGGGGGGGGSGGGSNLRAGGALTQTDGPKITPQEANAGSQEPDLPNPSHDLDNGFRLNGAEGPLDPPTPNPMPSLDQRPERQVSPETLSILADRPE